MSESMSLTLCLTGTITRPPRFACTAGMYVDGAGIMCGRMEGHIGWHRQRCTPAGQRPMEWRFTAPVRCGWTEDCRDVGIVMGLDSRLYRDYVPICRKHIFDPAAR